MNFGLSFFCRVGFPVKFGPEKGFRDDWMQQIFTCGKDEQGITIGKGGVICKGGLILQKMIVEPTKHSNCRDCSHVP